MMYKSKGIKLGVLSLSAGLLLAACDTDDTMNTSPVEETTQADDTTTDDATTDTDTDTNTDTDTDTDGSTMDEGTDTTDDTTTDDTTTDGGQGLESMDFQVSLDDAINTFHETFGSEDISIESIHLDRDDDRFIYEFEGGDDQYDYELDIDAETGEIVQQEQDEDTDTDEDALQLDNIITPQEAMDAALSASGSGYVEEWGLELEDGVTIYDVDVEGGDDQKIDAQSGEVVN